MWANRWANRWQTGGKPGTASYYRSRFSRATSILKWCVREWAEEYPDFRNRPVPCPDERGWWRSAPRITSPKEAITARTFSCTTMIANVISKRCEPNARATEVAVLGWCLMSNHVHLVGVPAHPESLAKALGQTQQLLAQRFTLVPAAADSFPRNRKLSPFSIPFSIHFPVRILVGWLQLLSCLLVEPTMLSRTSTEPCRPSGSKASRPCCLQSQCCCLQ